MTSFRRSATPARRTENNAPSGRVGAPTLYAMLMASSLVSAAFVPLAPSFARELSLTNVELGIALAAVTVPLLAVAAPLGVLGDRVSAKPVTLVGGGVLTVATAAHAVAFDFPTLLLARLGFGIGTAILWTAGLSWLAALGGDRRQSRALIATGSAAGLGIAIGPIYGGLLAEVWSMRAPFALAAVALAVTTLLLARAPRGVTAIAGNASLMRTLRELVGHRVLVGASIALALSGLAAGMTNLLVPLQLEANGVSVATVGLVMTLTTMLFTVGTAFVAQRGDRAASLHAGGLAALVLVAACILVMASSSTPATIGFLLLRVPAWVVLSTTPYAIIAVFAGSRALPYGAVIGILTQIWAVASSLAPIAAAAVFDLAGTQVAYLLLASTALAVAGWLLTQPPSARPIAERAAA